MISKVKSQGKRTVELRVVGRALRLPTHAFQFTSTPASQGFALRQLLHASSEFCAVSETDN
jgi:hypothetical protein